EDAGHAELAGPQAEVDELLVLVAIADDETLPIPEHGHGHQQLGLAAGLEAVVVARAEAGDLLDDVGLLVDLDGEHAAIDAGVAGGADRLGEGLVDLGDGGVQVVLDPQQHRHGQIALAQALDDIEQGDGVLAGPAVDHDGDLAPGGDVKQPRSPFADSVVFGGVFRCPGVFVVSQQWSPPAAELNDSGPGKGVPGPRKGRYCDYLQDEMEDFVTVPWLFFGQGTAGPGPLSPCRRRGSARRGGWACQNRGLAGNWW